MKRETLLASGVGLLVVVALLVAAAVPGVLAQPREDEVRPGHVRIHEMTIARGEVTGSSATLAVDTRLAHSGGPSENLSVLVRAVDLDSGMVAATKRLDVARAAGEREIAVNGTLTVPRQGGYRIESIVYQDDRRVGEGAKRVEGIGTLQPAYATSAVGFHRFDGATLPVVEYSVSDVSENRTTLDAAAHLTNTGDAPAGDLRVVFKLRQADSNIVADEAAVSVGRIRPGRTATPSASLTVPDGYNYYLDAILWKDGVIVGTARSAANLDPTETLSVNETTRKVGLEVSDFETDEQPKKTVRREAGATENSGGQPGFGVAAALAALCGALAITGRRKL